MLFVLLLSTLTLCFYLLAGTKSMIPNCKHRTRQFHWIFIRVAFNFSFDTCRDACFCRKRMHLCLYSLCEHQQNWPAQLYAVNMRAATHKIEARAMSSVARQTVDAAAAAASVQLFPLHRKVGYVRWMDACAFRLRAAASGLFAFWNSGFRVQGCGVIFRMQCLICFCGAVAMPLVRALKLSCSLLRMLFTVDRFGSSLSLTYYS